MLKKYFLITYGCQMNKSDSEKISEFFENKKYKPASSIKEADLVIINMCSVRQSAVDRVYGVFQKLKKIRKKKPKTILTGCILKKDRKNFKKLFDEIIDIKDLINLTKKSKKNRSDNISALVPIIRGCNNFCSYCVVPHTRGREFSRPAKEIICEIKNLAKKGIKEIWLLGQNATSYKDKKIKFPELLKKINKIPGNFWIRFTSCHPKDFSENLIKAMKEGGKITEYLNLPLQSGDNQVLKKMKRPYNAAKYKNLVKKIRKAIPGIALSTDIIVGFPGETKKQFKNTAKILKEIKYDMAYISKYSPRSGTLAAELKNNVSSKEKNKREKILTKILKKTALENNKKYLNKKVEVLMMNKSFGRTRTNKRVKIESKRNLSGRFIEAKIIAASHWGLKGKLK